MNPQTLFESNFISEGAFKKNHGRQARAYIGITIPLTAVVVALWFFWTTIRRRQEQARLKRAETLKDEKKFQQSQA